MDNAAKLYNKQFGDGTMSMKMFDKPTRQAVAVNVELAERDDLLQWHPKYNASTGKVEMKTPRKKNPVNKRNRVTKRVVKKKQAGRSRAAPVKRNVYSVWKAKGLDNRNKTYRGVIFLSVRANGEPDWGNKASFFDKGTATAFAKGLLKASERGGIAHHSSKVEGAKEVMERAGYRFVSARKKTSRKK